MHKPILASLALAALAAAQLTSQALAQAEPLAGSAAATRAPRPFTATYEVTYRGLGAGKLHVALTREPGTDRYVYETRADPTLLARLVVSGNAVEHSVMVIDGNGVRPLEWRLDDGRSGDRDDGELHFDWQNGQVRGEIGGTQISLPVEPGLQDRMSVQIAVRVALLRGEQPGTIPLVDDERIKHYTYEGGETEPLGSQLGEVNAVVYRSTRPGSSRVSKVWHSPEHEFIPVRAEQIRKGRVETVMVLTAFDYK